MSVAQFQNRHGSIVTITIFDGIEKTLHVVKDSVRLEYKPIRGWTDECPAILAKQLTFEIVSTNTLEFQAYFVNDYFVTMQIGAADVFSGRLIPFTVQEPIRTPPYIFRVQAIDFSRNYQDDDVFLKENLHEENDELYFSKIKLFANNNSLFTTDCIFYNAFFNVNAAFVRERYLHDLKYKDILDYVNSSLQLSVFFEGSSDEFVSVFFHDYENYNINELPEKQAFNKPFVSFLPPFSRFDLERKDDFESFELIKNSTELDLNEQKDFSSLQFAYLQNVTLELKINWHYKEYIDVTFTTPQDPVTAIYPTSNKIYFFLSIYFLNTITSQIFYYDIPNKKFVTSPPASYKVESSDLFFLDSSYSSDFFTTTAFNLEITEENTLAYLNTAERKMFIVLQTDDNNITNYFDFNGINYSFKKYIIKADIEVTTKKSNKDIVETDVYFLGNFVHTKIFGIYDLSLPKTYTINTSSASFAKKQDLKIYFSSFGLDKGLENIYHIHNAFDEENGTDLYLERVLKKQYENIQIILNAELDWDVERTRNPFLPFVYDYGAGKMMFNVVRGTLKVEDMIFDGEFIRRY